MNIATPQKIQFQKKILAWYAENKRNLPWRETADPYKILVSEVMLQQTQVARVIPKYETWFSQFPTLEHLANTTTADVLRAWSGLGYNRRALYLKKTAEIITKQYNGKWPQTIKELKKLPGIGEYTARAVLCFAFGQQIAVVDTNIKKVILTQLKETDDPIQRIADQLLPEGLAKDWNQALMDYSAAVLKKEKIFIPKQSKFLGSNRYYRGQVIKLLAQTPVLSKHDLQKQLGLDSNKAEMILNNLLKDGLIVQRNDLFLLPF